MYTIEMRLREVYKRRLNSLCRAAIVQTAAMPLALTPLAVAVSINMPERLQTGKLTLRLTIFWEIGEGLYLMYLMSDHSGQQTVIVAI
jgi:hypothetical protein